MSDSIVNQVARLAEGDSYSRAEFIPAFHVTPGRIKAVKRELLQTLSPVIARARQLSFAEYRMYSIHSFTRDYDVVVAAVIVRQPELST